jgi:hypothetical protein
MNSWAKAGPIQPGNLFWILGLFGGAVVLLGLGSIHGDVGHVLFGDALCGPWG